MNRHIFLIGVLGATAALSGCGPELFHADFEADNAGMRPSMSPPGPPTGDVIQVTSTDPNNLVVTDAGISGKSLRYSYSPTLSQVNFIGVETSPDPEEYWALWNGRADNFDTTTPKLNMNVGNFNLGLAELSINNGKWFASDQPLGDVMPGHTHTAIIHVNNSTGTYTVSVFQPGRTLSSRTIPLVDRGLISTDHVLDLYASYDNTSPANAATYLFDNVTITEKAPPMQ